MTPQPLAEVLIVGGGTAGWMAAAALSRFLANGRTRIRLVESEEIGTVGVGEATIPTIATFNAMLGIDEDQFVAETMGSFKLGIEFRDWGRIGERYFHPFGQFGAEMEGIAFHQFQQALRPRGLCAPLHQYSAGAAAAAAGRFARVPPDAAPPHARPVHAFHFDAGLYAAFLRRYAEARGVERVEGRIAAVHHTPTGDVAGVQLADGRRLDAQFFLDCSGFRGLLIADAMGAEWEDWSRWLPCDRAVAVPTADPGPLTPFTRATARSAGWQWRIPLQHRTGNGLVYASAYMDRDAAVATLLDGVEGEPLAEPRHLSFRAGRRREFWRGNVVALGLAGGFLEPLESTSIHLIQTGIARLLALFPDTGTGEVEREQYNRLMARAYDGVRDFIILHYHATTRDDSPFWNHLRTMEVPESLDRKIALFRRRGRFFREEDELFEVTSWVSVMLGQGIRPEGHDPLVDAIDPERLARAMERVRADIAETVRKMPPHRAYLDAHCAGREAAA